VAVTCDDARYSELIGAKEWLQQWPNNGAKGRFFIRFLTTLCVSWQFSLDPKNLDPKILVTGCYNYSKLTVLTEVEMYSYGQLRNMLMKQPDRLDIQIQLENQWPEQWAKWLTKHSQFSPLDHGQNPEHCQAGYGSKAYWRSMNPGT
jgi:hypothetical protein